MSLDESATRRLRERLRSAREPRRSRSRTGPRQGEATIASRVRLPLLALALCCAAISCHGRNLRIGKAGRDAFSFAPADIGARTGIFKKHGLDLEISSFGGDARVQQAMAADGIDIGLGSGPGLAFIVKGSPVKGIAAMADPPLTFALVVRNDGDIKTLDDLKGKKVGVSTVGSVTGWLVGETGRQKGWGYDGISSRRSATTPHGSPRSRPRRSTAR